MHEFNRLKFLTVMVPIVGLLIHFRAKYQLCRFQRFTPTVAAENSVRVLVVSQVRNRRPALIRSSPNRT
jgi:hypothetical protein